MYFRLFSVLSVLIVLGCSNLDSLTEEKLRFAEKRWNEEAPGLYKMKVEMTGNRTESSIFEVTVRSDVVVSLKRNGLVVRAGREQDYSMQGKIPPDLCVQKKMPMTIGTFQIQTYYL